MAGVIEKNIEEFKKEFPDFPEYILEQVKDMTPTKVTDEDMKQILSNIRKEYENSLINPYEAIGVITAQSVGEPSTQMTLNTFHFAGVAAQSVEGLPRLIEILDVKKNLEKPMMKIYPQKGKSEEDIRLLAGKIKETRLLEFVNDTDIDTEEKIVKLVLDLKALKKLNIDVENMVSSLDKKIKKSATIEDNTLILKGASTFELKDLMSYRELALESIVHGIKGIKDVSLVKEGDEIIILTQGISIKNVINMEGIDTTRLSCNDIVEMYENYGVEAARQVIINEIMDVVKSQGLSINERHVLLIADVMTYTGEPRGMTRYGIVADKLNVLTRASFETPLKHIAKGAMLNEHNRLTSITENVMTNQMVFVGTGIPKISVFKK